VHALLEREIERQRTSLQLIASENFTSPAVLAASASVLTNKYSEGYPGRRYYGGNVVADQVEDLARTRATELFGAEHANVQPHAGANANLAAYLALVEPGTPAGFERLRAARSALISWGARVGAPCPHDQTCPMVGSDWCHFAVRLERSALHRDLKAARLGYEDEKYSYLVVSPSPPSAPAARLVRSPRPHRGHVRLVLCETDGLTERVISRRDGELYRRARDARWGDRLELDSNT